MTSLRLKVAIVIGTVIIILAIIYLKSRVRLPKITLVQSISYYDKMAVQTRAYLSRVYPVARDTFSKMTPVDLALFYNGLDFIYNCCYTYSGSLASEWPPLKCCAVRENHMPYPPQGYFYFWPSYATANSHTVYSDGATLGGKAYPISLIGSQRPNVAWGMRADGGEVDASNRSAPCT